MQNALSVTPLPGYITLKLVEAETKTASGLELPDASQEKPQIGKVLAVGDSFFQDGTEIKPHVNIEDTVVFKKYTGQPVKLKDEEVQLVKFEDVMGIIEYGT